MVGPSSGRPDRPFSLAISDRSRATRLVIGFRDEHDAHRVMDVVPKRFGRFGLTVHPTRKKLVPFRQPPYRATSRRELRDNRPGTFDLLGFTHYWGQSQKGYWVVKLKTASDRFGRAVQSIDSWCRNHRHWSLRAQQKKLNEKLRGHYAYYDVTANSGALSRFFWEVFSGKSSDAGGSDSIAATAFAR